MGFNREVGEDGALYWSKEIGNLAKVIEEADKMKEQEILELEKKAKERVEQEYSWDIIVDRYEKVFKR